MTDENKNPKSALDLPEREAPAPGKIELGAGLGDNELEKPVPLDPDLVAAVRKQVMKELKSEGELVRQEKLAARMEAKKTHEEYVETMHASSDPWVDIQGWVETDQGVRVELDWNDAFVDHLKSEGVTGADDDQIVQRWVTLLLRDMTDRLDSENPEKSEYS